MSGVDAVNIDSLDDTVELAKKLSLKTNAIIGVSGISDIVTDGKNTAVISGGHAMMKKITGSGCMLSSVIGAFAAANPNNLFYAVSVAFGLYASCGRNAYKETVKAHLSKERRMCFFLHKKAGNPADSCKRRGFAV